MILAGDLMQSDVGSTVALTRFGIRGRLDEVEPVRKGMVPLVVDDVPLLAWPDELVAIDRPDSPATRAADHEQRAHTLLTSLATRKARA